MECPRNRSHFYHKGLERSKQQNHTKNEAFVRYETGFEKTLSDIPYIWDKVFQSGPSKICGRQPLKNLKGYGLLKWTISLQIFKGCLSPILLGPLLNTLSHMNHFYIFILKFFIFDSTKQIKPIRSNSS